jgi:hypothetical protein
MAIDDRPTEAKGMQVARLSMRHSSCGGKADLFIVFRLGKITYELFCHRCEYTEWWTDGETAKEKPE